MEVKALFWGAQTLKNNYIIVEVIWVLGIYSNNPPFMSHKKAIWKITPKSVILWSYCHIVNGRKLSNQSKQLSHETKKRPYVPFHEIPVVL